MALNKAHPENLIEEYELFVSINQQDILLPSLFFSFL